MGRLVKLSVSVELPGSLVNTYILCCRNSGHSENKCQWLEYWAVGIFGCRNIGCTSYINIQTRIKHHAPVTISPSFAGALVTHIPVTGKLY